jgi:hypothetical protein
VVRAKLINERVINPPYPPSLTLRQTVQGKGEIGDKYVVCSLLNLPLLFFCPLSAKSCFAQS